MAHLPQRPSLSRRVSLELRKGTNTKPFLRRLPSAFMQLARASSDLQAAQAMSQFARDWACVGAFCLSL